MANREAVLEMISRFSEDLSAIQKSIRWEDGDIAKLFSKTRIVCEKIIKAGQDTSDADFVDQKENNSFKSIKGMKSTETIPFLITKGVLNKLSLFSTFDTSS